MKYYFVFNPAAGQGPKGKLFLENYNKIKELNKYDINIYETVGVGDSTRFVAEICTKYPDEDICFFSCGGDGTMNEVVTGVANYPNAILGIIPTGSCNDFLKTFPDYDFMNLEDQLNGTIMPCDLLKVDEFYSLNVTNIGFDAKVNYDQIRLRPKFNNNVKKAYLPEPKIEIVPHFVNLTIWFKDLLSAQESTGLHKSAQVCTSLHKSAQVCTSQI